jgi:hypothetical protein|tara:strand:+ start:361 stop:702 length:342 start_codon:yes stop_codon:yes gene_type:complete
MSDKKPFNEKEYWENRTKVYLDETKNLHKWKDVLQENPREKYTYGKDLIMEIEENIDEYIFFEFMSAYKTLMEQMKDVNDGFNSTSHQMLMDYLTLKLEEARDEHFKNKTGVE